MPKNRSLPHIVSAQAPDLAVEVLEALETAGLAAAISEVGLGKTDVYVTFNDGSTYLYPDVNSLIALSVIADPNGEGVFQQIRYWPGYRRLN